MTTPAASSPAVRRSMLANRSKDTAPELAVRSALWTLGLRYRKHYRPLPDDRRVTVDVAFPARRVAVLVDGCFWHCCPEHGTRPKANGDWWARKLDANVERDARTTRRLREAGWTVVRVWEHEDPHDVAAWVAAVLSAVRPT